MLDRRVLWSLTCLIAELFDYRGLITEFFDQCCLIANLFDHRVEGGWCFRVAFICFARCYRFVIMIVIMTVELFGELVLLLLQWVGGWQCCFRVDFVSFCALISLSLLLTIIIIIIIIIIMIMIIIMPLMTKEKETENNNNKSEKEEKDKEEDGNGDGNRVTKEKNN